MRLLMEVLRTVSFALIIAIVIPFASGVWYNSCGDRIVEQVWLDRIINHLKTIQRNCIDPELWEILDYTIHRYNKISGFDVMICPCFCGDGHKYVGLNAPACPGVTIDPEVMFYPIREGALVLVHESLHDYFPFLGHAYVTPTMQRIEKL